MIPSILRYSPQRPISLCPMLLLRIITRTVFFAQSLWAFLKLNFSGYITGMVCWFTIPAISGADGMEIIMGNHRLSADTSGWFRGLIIPVKRFQKRALLYLSVNLLSTINHSA